MKTITKEHVESNAEKNVRNKVCSGCQACSELNPLCSKVSEYVEAFKDGYNEGIRVGRNKTDDKIYY